MAIRQEDLLVREAVVYRFPTDELRARQARAAMMRRRRTTLGVVAVIAATAMLITGGPSDAELEGPVRGGIALENTR